MVNSVTESQKGKASQPTTTTSSLTSSLIICLPEALEILGSLFYWNYLKQIEIIWLIVRPV